MRIIGVDPGTICTGYGIIDCDGNKHSMVDFGSINNRASDPISARFSKIYRELSLVFQKYNPQALSLEGVFYCKNINSAIKLGMARGIAILAAKEAGLEIAEYAPRRVKQSVVGYGNAHKSQVMQMIKKLLNIKADIKNEDDDLPIPAPRKLGEDCASWRLLGAGLRHETCGQAGGARCRESLRSLLGC